MKLNKSVFNLYESIIVLSVVLVLGFAGWYVHNQRQNPHLTQSKPVISQQQGQQTEPKKNGAYFRSKYKDSSQMQECLDEYYEVYPGAKPENQKPGVIYLAPPCPGIPQ
ncbi:MAG TPA: hypothetical protein VLF88_03075 [Candidatus Babeliales bacterium]|nr:hypothetical protein [Candidatus Babeliales bacterium]